jgi:hypothetical protein
LHLRHRRAKIDIWAAAIYRRNPSDERLTMSGKREVDGWRYRPGRRLRVEWLERRELLSAVSLATVLPTVLSTTPDVEVGSLGAGTTSLAIRFSQPVVGADVSDNYRLQGAGADALLGTADDTVVPLSAAYAGTTATLAFPALSESTCRLTVRSAITDTASHALDGDWVREFVVLPATPLFNTTPTYDLGGAWPGSLTCTGRTDCSPPPCGSSATGETTSSARTS